MEKATRYRPYGPDVDPYNDNAADYRFGQKAQTEVNLEHSIPLFLSDHDGEPDPSEFIIPLRKSRRTSISARILASVLAAAAVAVLFALFSSDAMRDTLINAKTSIASIFPVPSAAAQPDPPQATAREAQLKEPAQPPAPKDQAPEVQTVATAAATPTREEITAAYQSALQGGAPRAPAIAEFMIPKDAIHHLDPSEITSLLERADSLIASGDLAASRLVLRRAAEAGDARAAMTLAGTYDPAVLEKLGVHGVVPDVVMARGWYEKAKQFGATEATQRLEQLASKRP